MKKTLFIISFLLIFISLCTAQQQENTQKESFNIWGNGEYFKLSPVTDSLILGSGIALLGTDIFLDKIKNYNHIDFNNYTFNKSSIPTFDLLLMNDYSKPLHYASYGTLGLCGLTSAVFFMISPEEYLTISSMYTETLLWAYSVKEFGKIMVNRVRPYMYFNNYPQDKVDEGDWIKSFPSGHTTAAFTMATFTSYIYCTYLPDSNYKIAVIASSYGLALSTGVLRVLSGNHFYSDVLAGAVLGTFFGFTIPYLHSTKGIIQTKKMSVSINPMGINLGLHY